MNVIPPFDSVEIEVVKPRKQRYATAGDWLIVPGMGDKKVLVVRVTDTGDWRSNMAIAQHEFFEACLCLANGISQQQVDQYDISFEAHRQDGDKSEPGMQPDAPYHRFHILACALEMVFVDNCPQLAWERHEAMVDKLS